MFLLTGCQTGTLRGFTAKVVQVETGRDLQVSGVNQQPEITERIRLEGIDVPDIAQEPWGEMAKAKISQVISNQTILLESDAEPRDATGQRLAYVWFGGSLLNEVLVREGYALAVPHAPNAKYDQRLARAQDQARVLELGIWNPKQPMRQTPAEFRSQKRAKDPRAIKN